jgi:hypothetical protein
LANSRRHDLANAAIAAPRKTPAEAGVQVNRWMKEEI